MCIKLAAPNNIVTMAGVQAAKTSGIREDKPSNTIPAHLYKDGLRHIHPDPNQARSITVREAARIQSFEDDFEFLGSKGDQYKMIGNAFTVSIIQNFLSI